MKKSVDSPRPRLAYLLAASHSGSTLLTMLLGAQPGACTVGELKATSLGDPNLYRCSCKQFIRQCGFWKEIGREMAASGVSDFDVTAAGTSIFEVPSNYAKRLLAPLYRGWLMEGIRDWALALSPVWKRHLAEANHRNKALIQAVLSITGAEVVVDSSKVALRLKYLMRISALDVRVIRVIRDGRAVALTYIDDWNFADSSDPALRGGGSGKKRPSVRGSMADAANEWKRSNEAADQLVATLPRSEWMEVRYEELCANPLATLKKIAPLLGLDPKEMILDFRSREQHVIGNGMRMDTTSEIRLDERWKQHLSADDLRVFNQVAGALNRKYGYT